MKFQPAPRKQLLNTFDSVKDQLAEMKGPIMIETALLDDNMSVPASTSFTPILLRNMTVDHVHEGYQLICHTIRTPFRMSGLMIIAEDNNGDAVTLALYNYKVEYNPETSVPLDTILSIKNPYLRTFQSGDIGIRVDDPSMISVLSSADPILMDWKQPHSQINEL